MTAVLVAAVLSTVWAGLLALAEEAPGIGPSVGDPPSPARHPIPLSRALHLGRLALLILAGAGGGMVTAWWRRDAGGGAVAVVATVLLIFMLGDALPRALGTLAPGMATHTIAAARRSVLFLRPLVGVVTGLDRIVHRIIPSPHAAVGVLGAAQQDMFVGVLSLGDSTVADVMTQRLDIDAIPSNATWNEVLDFVRRSDHSRIPVYRDSLDDMIGILYAKDLVPAWSDMARGSAAWHELVRPAPFLPEAKPLAAQLRDFQRGPAHLGIVVDEFGGTAGIVTLEDILEEIVGEIHDEYDVDEEPEVEREGDTKFWVDGRLALDELAELLGSSIAHEDVSTVGGLIYAELGHVPRPGEELRIDGFRVVVEQVIRRRIRRVYFERLASNAPAPAAPDSGTLP
ncbi:MAG: HlyC/CorC family transporter [Gemmatimonadetes bacterium]|nr:HlyC/CorC family transporter [Gemmatimonadota bacterium]